MKSLKYFLTLIIAILAIPQLSFAISGSGISDAISNSINTSTANKAGAFVQDSAITAYIHAQLIATKGVPSNIGVTTNNGVVKLDGAVNSKDQANAVIKVALSATGVKVVDASKLTVKEKA